MKVTGKHGLHKDLNQSIATTLPKCTANFLDTQITGAAFMLQRTYGYILVSAERANDLQVAAALRQMRSIRTYGGYLVDVTGLGKTDTSLLYVLIMLYMALTRMAINQSSLLSPMVRSSLNGSTRSGILFGYLLSGLPDSKLCAKNLLFNETQYRNMTPAP